MLQYSRKKRRKKMFHVLVVDDDKNARFLLKELLESERYTVTEADGGDTALAVLDKEHVDLVIVDIMMPRVDGYRFTEELRTFDAELPVLMVSAKQLPEDRKRGFISGIDDFMSKPFDNEELLLHVKALLRRAKIESERKIVVGDAVLDYDSFTVSRPGEQVELPQKEFLLLYKLLSYPDKIFTRLQLMDEIWGFDCDTVPETVTVHVGRLRKRFENWDQFEIQSIRGLGYKAVRKV